MTSNMNLLASAECGVCLQLYTDPRILSCGHTYCQACLDPTLHTVQGKTGKWFPCPECRVETKQTKTGMVEEIKASSGSKGVAKCDGCRKTVLLGELFRCTTCKENSASAADAQIRVCCMCIVTLHRGHDYVAWLNVPSKADIDDAREKIDGYDGANAVDEAELQENKCNILTAIKRLEKMITERTASLATLKDDVNDVNALTKAQLAAKVQQAEQMMENGHIAAALEAIDECSRKLAENTSLQKASDNADAVRTDGIIRTGPRTPSTCPEPSAHALGRRQTIPRRSLLCNPSASLARQPGTSTSTATTAGASARMSAPSAPCLIARMNESPVHIPWSISGPSPKRQRSRFLIDDSNDE